MARLLQGAGIPYRSHASRKASMTSGYNGNSGGGGTSGAPAEGRPFQLFMSSRVPTAPMRRFPLRAGEKMGYQDPSSVNRSSVVRQSSLPTASPMNATSVPSRGTTHLNEYVSQDSVGMATMADYKAPSTGDFLRFKERATMLKEPVGIFKNNQIGVLFVQR